jgi:hypothetical protein
VGALLQNRLTVALTAQAQARSAGLPPAARHQLVTGFEQAGRSGGGVGAGQTAFHLPHGIPAALAHRIELIARAIFEHGFVAAMRPTMLMPIAVLVVGAASCLALRGRARQEDLLPEAEPTTATRA